MKGEGKRPLLRPARERGRGESWKGGTDASRRAPASPRSGRPSAAAASLPAPPGHRSEGGGRPGAKGERPPRGRAQSAAPSAALTGSWGGSGDPRRSRFPSPLSPRSAHPGPARPPAPRPRAGRLPYPQGPAASGALFGARSAPGCSPEPAGAVPGLGNAADQRQGSVRLGASDLTLPVWHLTLPAWRQANREKSKNT